MLKLLRSNLARMIKSKIFWIIIAAYALYSILLPLSQEPYLPYEEGEYSAEELLALNYGVAGFPVQGLLIAILSCVILGADFHNSTIRNKLAVGHTRSQLYIANLLTSATISMALNVVYFLFFFTIIFPLRGGFNGFATAQEIILLLVDGTLMMLSYSAIITLIITASKNPTAAIIVSIILLMSFMLITIPCAGTLDEVPYIVGTKFDEETGEIVDKIFYNLSYPSKAERDFCHFILDCFPTGQSFQLANEFNIRWQMPLYSLGMIVATSGAGILIFKRSNIK